MAKCPPAELCIIMHSLARLGLALPAAHHLAQKILDHLSPGKHPVLKSLGRKDVRFLRFLGGRWKLEEGVVDVMVFS